MPDYYDILGVDRTASADEIKRAFRRLAREHHPDVKKHDPQAEERFKGINEAYRVLSDPERRAHYDRFGTAEPAAGMGDVGRGFGPFDSLFDMFFGGRPGRPDRHAPERGADLRLDLRLTLEEAAGGVEKTIDVRRLETCSTCFGTGAARGSSPERCPTCGGAGEVRYAQRTVFGSFTQIGTCPDCEGTGELIRHRCADCRGSGKMEVARHITVKVPAGVDDGTRLRLAGEGEAGSRGGDRGDLYVFIHLAPHPVFERRGADLFCTVPVSMAQAALGDEITVPTLEGSERQTVPAGTQPGTVLTLRGKGMPTMRGGFGSLHVTIDVQIPTRLTAEQQRLLLDFAASRDEKIKPQTKKKLTEKMKEFLQ
ncbi:MAG TPA: molecular chaperone DnaJ [bacterium]|nr:molecular chaperone DnaJ [bacterium]